MLSIALTDSAYIEGWYTQQYDWESLCEILTHHDIRQKKDGTLWSPVSVFNCDHRTNDSVESVHLMVLDFDCGKPLETILPALRGFEMAIHSTHSHSESHPKFRIIIPLMRPVPGAKWKAFWRLWVPMYAPDCDKACKNPSRIYYLPSCPADDFADAFSFHFDGNWIDPDEILAEIDRVPEVRGTARTGARVHGKGDYRTLDAFAWAQATGLDPKQEDGGEGKIFVVCPWRSEHTDGKQGARDTYLLQKNDGGKPIFKCSHSHCQGRGITHAIEHLGRADEFCTEAWRPTSRAVSANFTPAPTESGTGPALQEHTDESVSAAIEDITSEIDWPIVDGHGKPKCGLANSRRFIETYTRNKTIRYNEFTRYLEVDGTPIDESAVAGLHEQMELASGQTKWSKGHIDSALLLIAANAEKYHPIREYLDGCQWDGVPRIADMVGTVMTVANPLVIHQRYLECFFIAAVARIYQPGCKADDSLILKGPQAARKSTFFSWLVPKSEWFSDDMGGLEDKDSKIHVANYWIIEWAELESMRRSNSGAVKSFLSRQIDRFRPPYGAKEQSFPRQSKIVGTTNEAQFLHDSTGNRRFHVIPVEHIDTDWVRENRDQLWGEAVAAYKAGKRWHLTDAEKRDQETINDELVAKDPWESLIVEWLPGGATFGSEGYYVTVASVLGSCLQVPAERRNRMMEMRVSQILSNAGWDLHRKSINGVQVRIYAAPAGFRDESWQ